MKTLYLATVICFLAITSCNKSESIAEKEEEYGISAEVDGKPVTFNYEAIADTTHLFPNYIQITGYVDSITWKSDYIFMSINGDPITSGTYVNHLVGDKQSSLSYVQVEPAEPHDPGPAPDHTIAVTSFTKTAIKGTFSGTANFWAQNQSTGQQYIRESKTITNGKFHVKLGVE